MSDQTPYTPSLAEAREAFQGADGGHDFKRVFNERGLAFDRLIAQVRANAWFAGYDKGNLDGYFGTSKERQNSPYAEFDPYREGQ
jgi:hypothetical protein